MQKPFIEDRHRDREDEELVMRARSGDRRALESLVHRHQGYIYNIAIRMLYHPHDADDAAQEIIIKALTRLSSFELRSSFRTWIYRIAFNHLLNMKRGRVESPSLDFDIYAEELAKIPDLDLSEQNEGAPEANLIVAESKLSCTMGMLLCLDRKQRLVFILGGILGTRDSVGAELLEISSANFRQRLARARSDLRNFMNDKCGLVNPRSPCRCIKKTKGFIQAGHVDPENLLFHREYICEIRDAAPDIYDAVGALDTKISDLYRRHPFYQPSDLRQMLKELFDSDIFQTQPM